MVVVLNARETGSAEIVVTAGSSSDPDVVIANFLGRTIGDVLRILEQRGYVLSFVTQNSFVCTKPVLAGRRGNDAKRSHKAR
ncbi:hypothetical protein [Alicyclobacillus acidiphilus]|uniref:hypothetical protein n=1 Tax=Alicyclobacillus acidiphilus TaxID=182455 RepID=UPI000829C0E1|nr:hypothetical protein [Alicyclobacillus acidiphilus]